MLCLDGMEATECLRQGAGRTIRRRNDQTTEQRMSLFPTFMRHLQLKQRPKHFAVPYSQKNNKRCNAEASVSKELLQRLRAIDTEPQATTWNLIDFVPQTEFS